ncbi:MAG: ribonuclease T2 [Sphingobium sp.]
MLKALLAFVAISVPGAALAQAGQCSLPRTIARPHVEGPSAREPRRVVPIGSYTLALTWSPQYCATARGTAKAGFQCGSDNRFGFTLHGLWPDGRGTAWPQYCSRAAVLPPAVIRQNLCATPSAQLIQHEWAKHGTCMKTTPREYFATARRLYDTLRYPDMAALAARSGLTVGAFAQAFAARNRGMTADMVRLNVTRGGMLNEVWVCLDRQKRYARCPAHQRGSAATARLRITPRA